MIFISIVLLAAFLIEGIGTYISISGLAALFSANPVIMLMAFSLDVGKVVAVTFLYKYWKHINVLMKSYMTAAAVVLMIITSAGAFGFLSSEFQKAISDTGQQKVLLDSLADEQARLQKRKEEIDKQIAQLPENNVRGRTTLIRQFDPEVKRINDRLASIDKELPALKVDSIKKNVEVGPIMFLADAFSTTPEKAVRWIILVIILVFDPLAIALLLAGNFLLERKKSEQKQEPANPGVQAEEVSTEDQHLMSRPDSSDLPKIEVDLIEEQLEKPVDSSIPVEDPPQEKIELIQLEQEIEQVPALEKTIPPLPAAPVKSSLDDVNDKRTDVIFDGDLRSSPASRHRSIYTDDATDTVKIGGPGVSI